MTRGWATKKFKSSPKLEIGSGKAGPDDLSVIRAYSGPGLILAFMSASAVGLSLLTGVDGSRVFLPYIAAWAALALLTILLWMFVEIARLAPTRVDRPIQLTLRRMIAQHKLVLIPGLIFPTFLGAYTWAKSSIPFAVGYPWESFWADADHALLGADAWRIAHAILPASLGPALTFFYAVVWGFGLAIGGMVVGIFGGRRLIATFFTALMLSWFVGGFLMAYALSAAGPVFAHLADPALADRFAPLRGQLVAILGPDDIVIKSQHYLAMGLTVKTALKGGGVSAMPSMHIATAIIFLLAARGTRWMIPAVAFLLLTFFGSVYLGYHYAIDAPIAAIVAVACWSLASRVYCRGRFSSDTRFVPGLFQ